MWEQLLAIFVVLGLLMFSLWLLRHKALGRLTLVRGNSSGIKRRLESLERISLSPNHSLHLVRVESRLMLIAVSPSGCVSLDTSFAPADSVNLRTGEDQQN